VKVVGSSVYCAIVDEGKGDTRGGKHRGYCGGSRKLTVKDL